MCALLAPIVLFVYGYHPMADDGAVYVAGIKKLADPALYPADAVFALAPTRLSIFAHVLAPLGHGWLPFLLLGCHVASIFLFLLGVWSVGKQVFQSREAAVGAVLLAACCFTLPIAGTSLTIMDPYATARSFSTPLSLFALAAVLKRKWAVSLLWLALTALFHPLMAAYTAIAMLTLACVERERWKIVAWLSLLAWLIAAGVFYATRSQDLGSVSSRAALSRSYFFLSSWQWYEYPGLILPLFLLGWAGNRTQGPRRAVALSAAMVGGVALFISLCFVHRSGSLLLARLQVLRAFQFVYLSGVVLAGGLLGSVAQRRPRLVTSIYLVFAVGLWIGQRLTYPESNHVEWPGMTPRNQWQQAFLWIRANTPRDAVFALDNDYIEAPGEDAQGFRAVAERSTIADWFKDGGIASNFPGAAALWWQGAEATARLNEMSDAERLARLQPLGAGWIVLPTEFTTNFFCPYRNVRVRVCRLAVSHTDSAK